MLNQSESVRNVIIQVLNVTGWSYIKDHRILEDLPRTKTHLDKSTITVQIQGRSDACDTGLVSGVSINSNLIPFGVYIHLSHIADR